MTEDQLRSILKEELTTLAGQLMKHVDDRANELRIETTSRLDGIANTLDGLAGSVHTDQQERAAIVAEQDRHRGWILQLADQTSSKLVPEP